MSDFTFLTEEQVFGENKLEIFKDDANITAKMTDFANLFDISSDFDNELNKSYWTKSSCYAKGVHIVSFAGSQSATIPSFNDTGARLVLPLSSISDAYRNTEKIINKSGFIEVEYGYYPQDYLDDDEQMILDSYYKKNKLKLTGNKYTDPSNNIIQYSEYELDGHRYIRYTNYIQNKIVWLKVQPIKWLVDEKNKVMVTEKLLFAGVPFEKSGVYKGDFENTTIKKFIDNVFAKEILQEVTLTKIKPKENQYGFTFDEVSEEDIIKGAIDSNVAVFLHGKPGEGKSSRIKQIDPNCEVLSLGTLTPELLVGMGIKNNDTKVVEYAPPPWYTRLVEKCEKESDKIHILFLDELNNASPNMQKYAFSIALDRKVNDRFELPKNVRIAAAGNEVEDSLSAYDISQPLYDRFAHVNIETTPEQWLTWASLNNIHPSIYAFIAYGGERVLRTEVNPDKQTPTADPRKWEMASKMLYSTKNPQMLRGLIGEDLTQEFISFCMQPVITVEEVINGDYDMNDYKNLNVSESYATVVSLSQVSEEHVEIIKDFIANLGPEFVNTFYSIWSHGDKERLEKVAELQMTSSIKKGGKR